MSATPEQLQAIEARGEVLVSASAGAGKTTVMIKRLADILEEGASLDNVLAVTFTKKAAAQMKEKLRVELIARLNAADGEKRENIRAQLGKINTADISTIHSFCARLIRTYFYALKVDASFEVLSAGAEENALRARAMDDLFDGLYASDDPDLYTLLEKLRKKRSDKALKEMLYEAYDEVRQRPDYLKLLDGVSAASYTQEGFEKMCAEYGKVVAEKYGVLVCAIEKFAEGFRPALNAEGYLKVLDEMRSTLIALIDSGEIFTPPSRLSNSVKPRVRSEVAEDDAAFSAFCDKIKKRYKAINKDTCDMETERRRFFESGAIAQAFVSVLKKFAAAYDGVKREESKLDYGDLEHYALALLNGEECDEDVRAAIREKYQFVFVDEYQDVNPIQDGIISAVAGNDIFCVGDLKQAIYGFRGSRSRFFAEKCGVVGNRGKYVILPDNFRSANGVIAFVNELFSKVMKPPVCEFDYADGHAMRGGARYKEGCGGVAEICLFEGGEIQKEEARGIYSVSEQKLAAKSLTAEGLAVLQLVEEALKSEYFDPDEGRMKKVETGDICVLTRKRANRSAQGIVRALTSRYPVAGAAEVNICDRPEIIRMLDVLNYLDNGAQDVELASALLSPLGAMTEGELAKIRIFGDANKDRIIKDERENKTPLFRECANAYAKDCKDGTAEKLNAFYGRVERLRTLSGSIGAARLIDEIICVGNFSAAYDTEGKLAALRRLQSEAYSPSGELYLGAFLAKVRAGGNKILAPAALASDCIKVMTMHASKGLEFPVVIVADIAASYAGDDRCEMPFDDDFGFAPRYFNAEDRSQSNTLLRRLYKMRAEREELSNEINLFYVACTRAKYALYILTGRADGYDSVKACYADNYADLFDIKAFSPRILSVEEQSGQSEEGVRRVLDESRADQNTLDELREISSYIYPYERGVDLPVKGSASGLLRALSEEGNAEILFDDEMEEGADTNAQAGIAYHRFLELCDFSKKDEEGVRAQLKSFESAGLMTAEQISLLGVEQLVRILSMSAFDGVENKNLYREREFVCRLPSADYTSLKNGGNGFAVGGDDGNGVILQGAIDLLAVNRRDGRAVSADIIDYKYSAHSESYISKKYAPQLALYRSVVCAIYGLKESDVSTTIINIRALKQIDLTGGD